MAHTELYKRLMNSKQWRKLRYKVLTEHPLCQACEQSGYITAAQCVHHITPVETGRNETECRSLAFSESNLMPLCYRCHAEIHKAEGYHTKAVHRQRAEERLHQWTSRHRKTPPG